MNMDQYKNMIKESELDQYWSIQLRIMNSTVMVKEEQEKLLRILEQLKTEDTMHIVLNNDEFINEKIEVEVIETLAKLSEGSAFFKERKTVLAN